MCSFNAINGVPGCGNDELMNEILKGEWGFDGFVESDWTAVAELRACPPKTPDTGECGHGVAADGPAAAALALNSGVDSEMTSTLIRDFGAQLLDERRISMKRIDDAVRRILRVKFRAGLFEHPYAPFDPRPGRGADAAARRRGGRAQRREPLDGAAAERGRHPAARPDEEDGRDRAAGEEPARHARPVVGRRPRQRRRHGLRRHRRAEHRARPTPRAASSRTPSRRTPIPEGCGPDADFAEAVAVAQAADQVVLALGETREMSGEAATRSTLDLPGRQEELIRAIKATGKPFVVVLFNGRPLALEDVDRPTRPRSSRRGSRACRRGPAVADVVFGKVNPGGKLPGVVPAPGRPGADLLQPRADRAALQPGVKWNSRYRDIPSCAPLFEFGFGLSYTTFEVSDLQLSSSTVSRNGQPQASVTRDQHGPARQVTRSCSSTSTTRWRASRSPSAGCAGSSA